MRIILNISLFFSIFLFPWWFTTAFALVLTFRFKNFYEILFAGLLIDLVYGTSLELFFNISFIFTIGSVIFLIIIENLKKYLKFY